ncbi:MAG: hypothetical protein BGN88_10970 [Clostridiales bacterium 43-6]|nr:MAG: hypothetical protein BGN88_10970 [Clostridiales bacterium 43-6]
MEKKSKKKRAFELDKGTHDTSPEQNNLRNESGASLEKGEIKPQNKRICEEAITANIVSSDQNEERNKNVEPLGNILVDIKGRNKRGQGREVGMDANSPELNRTHNKNNDASRNESIEMQKNSFIYGFIGSAVGTALTVVVALMGVAWTIRNDLDTTKYALREEAKPYIVMTKGEAILETNFESLQKEINPISETVVAFSIDGISEETGHMECRIDSKFSLYTDIDKYRCYYCKLENVGLGAMYKIYLSSGGYYQEEDYDLGYEGYESKDLFGGGMNDSFSEYIQPIRVGDSFYLIVNICNALPKDSYWFDIYVHYEDIYYNQYEQPISVHFESNKGLVEVAIEDDAKLIQS